MAVCPHCGKPDTGGAFRQFNGLRWHSECWGPWLMLELEDLVLDQVPDHDSEWVVYASAVAKEIGVPVDVCKAILRELRNKGLVRLTVACDQDTGAPHGSGYVKVASSSAGYRRPHPADVVTAREL